MTVETVAQSLKIFAVLLGAISSTTSAGNLSAVTATSTQKHRAFRAMNVIDRNSATAWCTNDASDIDATLSFIFKRKQKVDKIVVTPFLEHEQGQAWLKVSDGFQSVRFPLGQSIQELELPSPMNTQTLRVSLERRDPTGDGPDFDVSQGFCIAEIGLWYRNKNLSRHFTKKQLSYQRHRDPILGKWNGGALGAPEKFIIFAADGTWSFIYTPLYDGKSKKMSGQFRFRGNRLLMREGDSGRWADTRLKKNQVSVDPDLVASPIRNYRTFSLNGALDPLLVGQYNDARF